MNNPIILALDVETAEEAQEIVTRVGDAVDFYKVGLELYASAGMEFPRSLLEQKKRVFLDLKLHDIGETVKRAVAQVARVGVNLLTVHATPTVMRAAVEGRGNSRLKLLAVTVLTDVSEADLKDQGLSGSVRELVMARARKAKECGIDGIVCSALEVGEVRSALGMGTILVTPGVRSAGADKGDQKRVATPAEAMASGSDYLVIGRQVTRAADPRAEVERILEELRPVGKI